MPPGPKSMGQAARGQPARPQAPALLPPGPQGQSREGRTLARPVSGADSMPLWARALGPETSRGCKWETGPYRAQAQCSRAARGCPCSLHPHCATQKGDWKAQEGSCDPPPNGLWNRGQMRQCALFWGASALRLPHCHPLPSSWGQSQESVLSLPVLVLERPSVLEAAPPAPPPIVTPTQVIGPCLCRPCPVSHLSGRSLSGLVWLLPSCFLPWVSPSAPLCRGTSLCRGMAGRNLQAWQEWRRWKAPHPGHVVCGQPLQDDAQPVNETGGEWVPQAEGTVQAWLLPKPGRFWNAGGEQRQDLMRGEQGGQVGRPRSESHLQGSRKKSLAHVQCVSLGLAEAQDAGLWLLCRAQTGDE